MSGMLNDDFFNDFSMANGAWLTDSFLGGRLGTDSVTQKFVHAELSFP
jgi:hypothetical protein